MIAKKIPNPKKAAKKSERISELLDYVTAPERENGLEKCIASGAGNFLTSTHGGRKLEMVALAEEAVRSRDPIDHWVLSWAPGEQPTIEQVQDAVEMFVAHCGVSGHQYVWGYHDDTEIRHAHIVLNRVHPDTHRVTEINRGFDREAAMQAIALIEHKQGWAKAESARYTVENGRLVLTPKGAKAKGDRSGSRRPDSRAQAMETRTGEKSVARRGIEDAAPIIARASSWKELHEGLVAIGMEYRKTGSGARIFLGDFAVKASDVDRKAALGTLEKRLGHFQSLEEMTHDYHRHTIGNPYQPHFASSGRAAGQPLRKLSCCRLAHDEKNARGKTVLEGILSLDAGTDRRVYRGMRRGGHRLDAGGTERVAPQPLHPSQQPSWTEYLAMRDEYKAQRQSATAVLKSRHQKEWSALLGQLKTERAEALAGNWRGKGAARNAQLSLIATRQAAEKLALQQRQAAERKALRERFPPLALYRDWIKAPGIVGLSEGPEEASEVVIKVVAAAGVRKPGLADTLRLLEHRKDWQGRLVFHANGADVFRDEGRRLAVLNPGSDEAIAVTLAVARQKYGSQLTLTGSEAFQRRVVAVAVAEGLKVTFADPKLEALRHQIEAARVRGLAKASAPLSSKEKWADAKRTIASNLPPPEAKDAAPARGDAPMPAPAEEGSHPPVAPVVVDHLAEWLASHPGHRIRDVSPMPASGSVQSVLPDGRVLVKVGRDARDLAVYPMPEGGFTSHIGRLVEIDGHGRIREPDRGQERELGW